MQQGQTYLGEFTFINKSSWCEIETIVDKYSGTKINRLVAKINNQADIRMAYTIGEGLKISNSDKKKNNPLGEFLGLEQGNLEEVKSFIDKYGFFYNVSSDDFFLVNIDELFNIQERLQAFIILINNQVDLSPDFDELFGSIIYLLLKKYDTFSSQYSSQLLPTDSDLKKLLESSITPLSKDHNLAEPVTKDGFTQIIFTRYAKSLGRNVEMDLQAIQDIVNDEETPYWCKSILSLFFSLDNLDFSTELKEKIDFLFGCIYLVDPFNIDDLKLKEVSNIKQDIDLSTNPYFVDSLYSISKLLITEEFDRCLSDVKFTYNTSTMTPDWELPSLIGALYFSIFYQNSKNTIYRVCANDNCNQYFQVSKTNSTKIHCCDNCRENKNARNLRARKKQGK
ncbi:hypothetical protein [Streptococcus uberis]|uniref:hypothetical protein n=1 Tax=Streptococcus uberis TaxID=1349 RepID=UPI001C965A33|nr:hypothetical protein [Streptococcus uberis]MBY4764638.1 hypothetical protein [Streptococcus uberis]